MVCSKLCVQAPITLCIWQQRSPSNRVNYTNKFAQCPKLCKVKCAKAAMVFLQHFLHILKNWTTKRLKNSKGKSNTQESILPSMASFFVFMSSVAQVIFYLPIYTWFLNTINWLHYASKTPNFLSYAHTCSFSCLLRKITIFKIGTVSRKCLKKEIINYLSKFATLEWRKTT